ncbi:MAG: CIA30 family protein [Bacteroidetes bacterium]|nr:CIA30 family protein [Bacteroidota bacterium]
MNSFIALIVLAMSFGSTFSEFGSTSGEAKAASSEIKSASSETGSTPGNASVPTSDSNNHPSSENAAPAEVTLIDFSNTEPAFWQILNDNVMGGVSRSAMEMHADGFAVFRGMVSLRNNGGFASMRTQARNPADLSGFEGITVRVLGDGKTYSLRLKTVKNGRVTWYAYESRFSTTPGVWETHTLPFSDFRAVYRGSYLRENPPLNTDALIELGFMIKDGQEGPFQLGIRTVSVYW